MNTLPPSDPPPPEAAPDNPPPPQAPMLAPFLPLASPPPAPKLQNPYRQVLAAAQAQRIQVWICGDHATDLWGRFYADQEPGTQHTLLKIDKSMTLLCSAGAMFTLAHALQAAFNRVQGGGLHPVTGVLSFGQGASAYRVEFVQRLSGVNLNELRKTGAELVSPELNLTLHLPSPWVCLKAKIHEISAFSRPREQDPVQLRTLMLSNRGFLREAVRAVEGGTLPERKLTTTLEAFFKFTTTRAAIHAAQLLDLDWLQIFPLVELLKTPRLSLQKFLRKRLQTAPSYPGARPEETLDRAA